MSRVPRETGNADATAMALAERVHEMETPEATILFGSRARGDHREDSDVDIMVVTTEDQGEPDAILTRQAQGWGRNLYGRDIDVDIVTIGLAKLEEEKEFINSLTTQALLDGLVISSDPDRFESPYGSENPPKPSYEWSTQKSRAAIARLEADVMMAFAGLKTRENPTVRYAILAAKTVTDPQERRNLVTVRAKLAITFALNSVASATGALTKRDATIKSLLQTMEEKSPGTPLGTKVDMMDYEEEKFPDKMSVEKIAATAKSDMDQLLKLANRLKRATQKGTSR